MNDRNRVNITVTPSADVPPCALVTQSAEGGLSAGLDEAPWKHQKPFNL